MELVNSGPGGTADPRQTYWEFACILNYPATPKTIVWPAGTFRTASINFIGQARGRLIDGPIRAGQELVRLSTHGRNLWRCVGRPNQARQTTGSQSPPFY
jgi:hypothetical protein